ncbi:DUF4105 domain-containing protein [Corallibacter sp.]|uniref:lipoprotein N-acyltransferase Lnb domain-containing protein n=1 Tax=Corallibacter sp. TaxID=2038084 RepID=UPI003A95A2B1
MKIKLFLTFLLFGLFSTTAQELTKNAQVSVLTIGPGTSLNDAFGHSAFRIKDSNFDYVFNYGVYNFNTPNFYTKFARGKLEYLIGLDYYEAFFNAYVRQNRTVKEQILNISPTEKQKLFDFLVNNYKPENRAYLYDFFYDNCATKIKDVLQETLNNTVVFHTPENYKEKSFRTLIQDNLNYNSWGSLGIDIALGSVIDKTATPEEHMFLPENIFTFFNDAEINNKNLVKEVKILYKKQESKNSTNLFTSPLFILGLISLGIIFITYRDYKNKTRAAWLDNTLFALTSIIGVLLLLLWFATDHTATAQNYNLLWAFPLNILLLFQLQKPLIKSWSIKFIKFLVIMLCLMTFHWVIGVQVFAIALAPIIVALLIRYIYLIYFFQDKQQLSN